MHLMFMSLKRILGWPRSSAVCLSVTFFLILSEVAAQAATIGPGTLIFRCRSRGAMVATLSWEIRGETDLISDYKFQFFARRGTPAGYDTELIRVGGQPFAFDGYDLVFSQTGANYVDVEVGNPTTNPLSFVTFVSSGRFVVPQAARRILCFIPGDYD